MSDNSRIDDLRRRVQADPTSIAFAALAEEYRRAGLYEEAVEVCRSGLTRHPAYISARVTLGRALIELNQLDEAKMELDQVLSIAPENLAAVRALAELRGRAGGIDTPTAEVKPAAPPALRSSGDAFELDLMPPVPARVVPFPTEVSPPQAEPPAPVVTAAATFDMTAAPLDMTAAPLDEVTAEPSALVAPAPSQPDPVLERLERFLKTIVELKAAG